MSGVQRFRRITCAVVLSCLFCSCGVRPQEHPDPVESRPTVGRTAGDSSITPSEGTTDAATAGVVYLIRSGRLTPVRRNGRNPQSLLTQLLAGPTTSELAAGLGSAIPATGNAMTVALDGSVARVQLPAEFSRLDGAQQALAVAQLVYTLTEEGLRVSAVRLMRGARELPAPTATGQLVSRPVTRDDYGSVSPP